MPGLVYQWWLYKFCKIDSRLIKCWSMKRYIELKKRQQYSLWKRLSPILCFIKKKILDHESVKSWLFSHMASSRPSFLVWFDMHMSNKMYFEGFTYKHIFWSILSLLPFPFLQLALSSYSSSSFILYWLAIQGMKQRASVATKGFSPETYYLCTLSRYRK